MFDQQAIAARLKEARLARGMSVQEWADLLGDGEKPSRITDVERLKQRPPHSMLLAAVERAALSSNWLLTGAGPMLAGGKPASAEAAIAAVQAVSLKLAGLGLKKETMRAAHQWLVAVELADVESLDRLAATAVPAAPGAQLEMPCKADDLPDTDVLARVLEAIQVAIRQLDVPPPIRLQARVAATLYGMAGRGLAIDAGAAGAAIELAMG